MAETGLADWADEGFPERFGKAVAHINTIPMDQAGRQAQATFNADQWARELAARQGAADFMAGEAKADQAGRAATAEQQQSLAAFLQSEAGKKFEADTQNAGLKREDIAALAQIYAMFKGQKSMSSGSSRSDSFSFDKSDSASIY